MIDVNRYPPPPLAAICPRCSARIDIGANSVEEFAGREVMCVCGCQFEAVVFALGPARQPSRRDLSPAATAAGQNSALAPATQGSRRVLVPLRAPHPGFAATTAAGLVATRAVFVTRHPGFFPPGCFARRHPLVFAAVIAICIVLQWLLSR
jgi:hypothetical protein